MINLGAFCAMIHNYNLLLMAYDGENCTEWSEF